MKLTISFSLILASFLLLSCGGSNLVNTKGFNKRKYTPGYYTESLVRKNNLELTDNSPKNSKQFVVKKEVIEELISDGLNVTKSTTDTCLITQKDIQISSKDWSISNPQSSDENDIVKQNNSTTSEKKFKIGNSKLNLDYYVSNNSSKPSWNKYDVFSIISLLICIAGIGGSLLSILYFFMGFGSSLLISILIFSIVKLIGAIIFGHIGYKKGDSLNKMGKNGKALGIIAISLSILAISIIAIFR